MKTLKIFRLLAILSFLAGLSGALRLPSSNSSLSKPMSSVNSELSSSTSELAKSVLEALLKGVAGKFGALIVNALFPSNDQNYFDELYKQLSAEIHKEIVQSDINMLDGKINGKKNWVKNTYMAHKNKDSKSSLLSMLKPQEQSMADITGQLQQPEFAEPALGVFFVATGLHLSMLQEMALVDPQSSPKNSAWASAVKKWAGTYASQALSTYEKIEKTRLSKITTTDNTRHTRINTIYDYDWQDSETNTHGHYSAQRSRSGTWANGKTATQAKSERDKAVAAQRTKAVNAIKGPLQYDATVAAYQALNKKPVP